MTMDGQCLRGHKVDIEAGDRCCPSCGAFVSIDRPVVTVTLPYDALEFIVGSAERMVSLVAVHEQNMAPRRMLYSIADYLEEQVIGETAIPLTILGEVTAARARGVDIRQSLVLEGPL
jgi:hypothetical protein